MQSKILRIWIELGGWLAIAFTAFALTFEFDEEPGAYAWGAASWPRAVILLMVIAAITQCLVRLWRANGAGGDAEAQSGAEPAVRRSGKDVIKIIGAFALPLVYVFLLPRTGFYATTLFFLFAYLAWLGERRPAVLIAAPLLIYAIITLIFVKLFYVPLPTGTWPGFYDFSNWFLVTVR